MPAPNIDWLIKAGIDFTQLDKDLKQIEDRFQKLADLAKKIGVAKGSGGRGGPLSVPGDDIDDFVNKTNAHAKAQERIFGRFNARIKEAKGELAQLLVLQERDNALLAEEIKYLASIGKNRDEIAAAVQKMANAQAVTTDQVRETLRLTQQQNKEAANSARLAATEASNAATLAKIEARISQERANQAALSKAIESRGSSTDEENARLLESQTRINELIKERIRLRVEERLKLQGKRRDDDAASDRQGVASGSSQDIKIAIKHLRGTIADLNAAKRELEAADIKVSDDISKQIQQKSAELDAKRRELQDVIRSEKGARTSEPRQTQEKEKKTIESLTEAYKKLREEVKRARDAISNAKKAGLPVTPAMINSLKEAKKNAKEAGDELVKMSNKMRGVRGGFLGTGDSLSMLMRKVSSWLSATTAVFALLNSVRSTVRAISDVDTGEASLAKLYRSDNMAEQSAAGRQLTENAQQKAILFGARITDIQQQMQGFVRQGYNVEQVTGLVDASLKLQIATSLDAADAQKFLTNQMEAYNLSISDVAVQVDALNALENNFAAETRETATAIQKTAAAAAHSGVELEELGAIVAATIESTQLTGSEVGTAYKTIFARMNTEKVIESLKEIGIQINLIDEGTRRQKDSFSVLQELAAKWKFLEDPVRKQVAIAVAGTRQWSIFASTMDNFGRVLDGIKVQYDSVNGASEEVARMQLTIAGRWDRLKNTIQAMLTDNNRSGGLKDFLIGMIGFLERMAKGLDNNIGLVKELTGVLGALGALKVWGALAAIPGIAALLASAPGWVPLAIGGVVATGGFVAASRATSGPAVNRDAEIQAKAREFSDLDEQTQKITKLQGSYEALAREMEFAKQTLDALNSTSDKSIDKDREREGVMKRLSSQFNATTAAASLLKDGNESGRIEQLNSMKADALRKGSIEEVTKALKLQTEEILNQAEAQRKARLAHIDSMIAEAQAAKGKSIIDFRLAQGERHIANMAVQRTEDSIKEFGDDPTHAPAIWLARARLGREKARQASIQADIDNYKRQEAEWDSLIASLLQQKAALLQTANIREVGDDFDPPGKPKKERKPRIINPRFPNVQIGNLPKVGEGAFVDITAMFTDSADLLQIERKDIVEDTLKRADAAVQKRVADTLQMYDDVTKDQKSAMAQWDALVREADRLTDNANAISGTTIKAPSSARGGGWAPRTYRNSDKFFGMGIIGVLSRAGIHMGTHNEPGTFDITGSQIESRLKALGRDPKSSDNWKWLAQLLADRFGWNVAYRRKGMRGITNDHFHIADPRLSPKEASRISGQSLVFRSRSGVIDGSMPAVGAEDIEGNRDRFLAQQAAQAAVERARNFYEAMQVKAQQGDAGAIAFLNALAGREQKRSAMMAMQNSRVAFMGVRAGEDFFAAKDFPTLKLTYDDVQKAAEEVFGTINTVAETLKTIDGFWQVISTAGLGDNALKQIQEQFGDITEKASKVASDADELGLNKYGDRVRSSIHGMSDSIEAYARVVREFGVAIDHRKFAEELKQLGIFRAGFDGSGTRNRIEMIESMRSLLAPNSPAMQFLSSLQTGGVGSINVDQLQTVAGMLQMLGPSGLISLNQSIGDVMSVGNINKLIDQYPATQKLDMIGPMTSLNAAISQSQEDIIGVIIGQLDGAIKAADKLGTPTGYNARTMAIESMNNIIENSTLTESVLKRANEFIETVQQAAGDVFEKMFKEDTNRVVSSMRKEIEDYETQAKLEESKLDSRARSRAAASRIKATIDFISGRIQAGENILGPEAERLAAMGIGDPNRQALESRVADYRNQLASMRDMLNQREAERVGFIAEREMGIQDLLDEVKRQAGESTGSAIMQFAHSEVKSIADIEKQAAATIADRLKKLAEMYEDILASGGEVDPKVRQDAEDSIRTSVNSAATAQANAVVEGLRRQNAEAMRSYRSQRRLRLAQTSMIGRNSLESQLIMIGLNQQASLEDIAEKRSMFQRDNKDALNTDVGIEIMQGFADEEVRINEDAQDRIAELYRSRMAEVKGMYQDFFESIAMDVTNLESAFKKLSNQIIGDAVKRMIEGWNLPGDLARTGMRGWYGDAFKSGGVIKPTELAAAAAAIGGVAGVATVTGMGRSANSAMDRLLAGSAMYRRGGEQFGPAGQGRDTASQQSPTGHVFRGIGGSNSIMQAIGFSGIGLNAAQSGNALTSSINGAVQGGAMGGWAGALIGGAVGLIGSLFHRRRREPPKPPEPYSLPTSADLRFAAPWLLPRQAFLGGRSGASGPVVDNSASLVVQGDIVFPNVRDAQTARDAANAFKREFASGSSLPARQLEQQVSRVSVRR